MKKGSDNRSKQSGKQGIQGDKEKKERRKINKRERRERIKQIGREREREKWERETKREIFPAFRRLNLDGPRRKVDPRNAGYVWVPKS